MFIEWDRVNAFIEGGINSISEILTLSAQKTLFVAFMKNVASVSSLHRQRLLFLQPWFDLCVALQSDFINPPLGDNHCRALRRLLNIFGARFENRQRPKFWIFFT